MSNVYSGFPQRGQMRTNASVPPLSSEDGCRSVRTSLVEWAVLKLDLFFYFFCHLCCQKQVSYKANSTSTSERCHFSWCCGVPGIPFKPSLRLHVTSASAINSALYRNDFQHVKGPPVPATIKGWAALSGETSVLSMWSCCVLAYGYKVLL